MTTPGSMPAPPFSQVPPGDPTAVMGRRIGAYIIDVVLGWVVFLVLLLTLGSSFESLNGADLCGAADSPAICFDMGGTVYYADDDTGGPIMLLTIGFWLFMGIVVQGATGGTPGKLMVGLRVVDQQSGRQLGYGKAAARTLLWVVDAIPFIFPLVGLITGVSTKGHRRVGDMVANTLVVDRQSVGYPPLVHGLTQHATSPPAPGGMYAPAPTGPPTDPFTAPAYPVIDAEPPQAAQAATSADGVDAPKWDADRGAYIQWDKANQQWMVYDDAETRWKPLL